MSLASKVIRYLNENADHRPIGLHQRYLRGALHPDTLISALSVPRGQAKSWLIGNLMAAALNPGSPLFEPGIEDVCVSGSLDQSRVMVQFLRQHLEAQGRDDWVFIDSSQRIAVRHKDSNTRMRVLSSSGKRALGLANFRRIYADEPAAWDDRGGTLLWNALRTSLGKTAGQSVHLIGTLCPSVPGNWWPELVAGGSGPGKFVMSLTAAPGEPWDAWQTIRKVNPMTFCNPHLRKVILLERDDARKRESLRPSFEAFRLNRHIDVSHELLVPLETLRNVERREVPEREGRPILGLDVGSERSWTAAWAMFENGRSEVWAIAPGIPDLHTRERQDAIPSGLYSRLVETGRLLVDEGRHVARPKILIKHLQLQGITPRMILCDRFMLTKLRDVVQHWAPITPRTGKWSESTEDICSFRELAQDGPLMIEKTSRPLVRLGLSQGTVQGDRKGNLELVKRRGHRSRDDVAIAGTLAAGELVRTRGRYQGEYLGLVV